MQLNIATAAGLLRTTEKQIYRWIEDGDIPFVQVHDQVRFNRLELLEWAASRRRPVSLAVFHDAKSGGPRAVDVRSALTLGGVHHDVAGADFPALVRVLIEHLVLPEQADRELLLQLMLARGSRSFVHVGDGIAIPSARFPITSGGAAPSITLCLLRRDVCLEADDRQRIHAVFVVVSPTIRIHIGLLAGLLTALGAPAFRQAIVEGATASEIIQEALRATSAPPAPNGA